VVVALWRGDCDWVHGGAGHAGLNGDGELGADWEWFDW
jgi:hypothetical protein